jgi:hypothetical protein
MSRIFVGVGRGPAGGSDVYVEQNGERQRLTRSVRRVHEGYSWDQAGPHSTELARTMLWLVSGGEPPWALYRGFTSDVVAHLPVPVCEGECWRLSEAEIQAWLHDVGWLTIDGEHGERGAYSAEGASPAQAKTRRRAIRDWKERAKLAATLFRKRALA